MIFSTDKKVVEEAIDDAWNAGKIKRIDHGVMFSDLRKGQHDVVVRSTAEPGPAPFLRNREDRKRPRAAFCGARRARNSIENIY